MNSLLLARALLAGQAIQQQSKPVVHLKPNTELIETSFGGSLPELSHARRWFVYHSTHPSLAPMAADGLSM